MMQLQYQNLFVRDATPQDASLLCRWWNDGDIMAHAGFPNGLNTTAEQIAGDIAGDSDFTGRRLILEWDSVPIGEMNYRIVEGSDGRNSTPQVAASHGPTAKVPAPHGSTAQIGIKICDAEKCNQGLGRLYLSLMIDGLFVQLGCEAITLDTNLSNTRAQRVYEILGFRKAGVNVDSWQDALGRWQSSVSYRLTRADFVNLTDQRIRLAVQREILALRDQKYCDFQSRLIPNIPAESIVGVRMPLLRKLAKSLVANKLSTDNLTSPGNGNSSVTGVGETSSPPVKWQAFFLQITGASIAEGSIAGGSIAGASSVYYEEILVAGLALSYAKLPLEERFRWIRRFVPHIDNWAVCDTFCGTWKPRQEDVPALWNFLQENYLSVLDERAAEYDLRYGVVMLLTHFVSREDYIDRILDLCNRISHPAYYVKMAVAWALSYAFIFFPDRTVTLFQSQNNRLDDFTFNKSIQKACESYRVSGELKAFLRSLRRSSARDGGPRTS